MKKYHYSDGVNSHGPFTLQELKDYNIRQDTMVWFEGMANWQAAGSIPELNPLFAPAPPPGMAAPPPRPAAPPPQATPHAYQYQQNVGVGTQVPPKKWLVESILVTIFCCLPFGIIGIVYATKIDNLFAIGDYNGAMEASKNAGKWVKLGFFIGLGVYVLYLLFILISGVGFASWFI